MPQSLGFVSSNKISLYFPVPQIHSFNYLTMTGLPCAQDCARCQGYNGRGERKFSPLQQFVLFLQSGSWLNWQYHQRESPKVSRRALCAFCFYTNQLCPHHLPYFHVLIQPFSDHSVTINSSTLLYWNRFFISLRKNRDFSFFNDIFLAH